jgi:predicted ABC-type transport system involved in lysophospholipase L1 biosynthesis ATPase subunit
LLADEPTGNLDEKTSEHVMDLLFELVREESASLLLVTHNPAYARRTEIRWRLRLGHLEPES